MRIVVVLIGLMISGPAVAQQCPQCTAADICIRDYARAVAKIKADYRKGMKEQRKGREQSLREHFSARAMLAEEGGVGGAVQLEIDKLRDCLGRIR